MRTYRVSWDQITHCWATVDADNEEEAITKAKNGEYNDDCDSDPGPNITKSYRCDGELKYKPTDNGGWGR